MGLTERTTQRGNNDRASFLKAKIRPTHASGDSSRKMMLRGNFVSKNRHADRTLVRDGKSIEHGTSTMTWSTTENLMMSKFSKASRRVLTLLTIRVTDVTHEYTGRLVMLQVFVVADIST